MGKLNAYHYHESMKKDTKKVQVKFALTGNLDKIQVLYWSLRRGPDNKLDATSLKQAVKSSYTDFVKNPPQIDISTEGLYTYVFLVWCEGAAEAWPPWIQHTYTLQVTT